MSGPVAITGAGGQIGSALRRRLADAVEVRPVARGDDLAAALRDAAAVAHLAGTLRPRPPDTYEGANLGTVERLLAAVAGSSVERIVFLSYVGADPRADNAYLRAKGRGEELLHESGRDCVVFRCTHVFGPPDEPGPTVAALLAEDGRSVWVPGGSQRVSPVFREDVVDAIVAALDLDAYHGRFDLPGPEETTFDDFVRVVNRGPVRVRHVPPRLARAAAHAAPGTTPELVDVLLADSVGEQHRAERTFGLVRRGPSEVYGRRATAVA